MKRTALIAALAATLVAFTACGDSSDEQTSADAQQQDKNAAGFDQNGLPLDEMPVPQGDDTMHGTEDLDEAQAERLAELEQYENTDINDQPLGTRTDPLPIGETVTFGTWSVTVTEVTLDDSGAPLDPELPEMSTPPGGVVVTTVLAEVTHNADADVVDSPFHDLDLLYVGGGGNAYEDQGWLLSDAFTSIGDLYGGATEQGSSAAFVPPSDTDGGVWVVEYWNDDFTTTRAYFEANAG